MFRMQVCGFLLCYPDLKQRLLTTHVERPERASRTFREEKLFATVKKSIPCLKEVDFLSYLVSRKGGLG